MNSVDKPTDAPTSAPRRDHALSVARWVIGVLLMLSGAAVLFHQVWEPVIFGTMNYYWRGLAETGTALAAAGYAVFLLGWIVLPTTGARRAGSTVLAVAGLWMLANSLGVPYGSGEPFGLVGVGLGFAGPLGGPAFFDGNGFAFGLVGMSIIKAIAFTLVAAAWLVARARPAGTYVVLLVPAVAVFALSAFAPGVFTMGLGWGGASTLLSSLDVSPLARLLDPVAGPLISWLGARIEYHLLTIGAAIGWLLIIGGTGLLAARLSRRRSPSVGGAA